jgi:prepilin-type N-terminal cleavage/methylation domain-containing protein
MSILSCPSRGFSLIEVVVAIAIVGVVSILPQAILGALPLARIAKHQDLALTIAEHKLEQVRALGYAVLPASGPFTNSLQSDFASSSATLAVNVYNAKTKWVNVTVFWNEPNIPTTFSVSLDTLIAEVGGLP